MQSNSTHDFIQDADIFVSFFSSRWAKTATHCWVGRTSDQLVSLSSNEIINGTPISTHGVLISPDFPGVKMSSLFPCIRTSLYPNLLLN